MENKEFKPLYKLINAFPGMNQEVGTVFGEHEGWGTTLGTEGGQFSTEWNKDTYFEPWVGKFFERI